ncbi:hypothetical protein E2320_013340 [Naja naja]|nr:hypothetical protein E2320_013340 [Naja naja]
MPRDRRTSACRPTLYTQKTKVAHSLHHSSSFFTTAASKEDQSFLNTVSATGWPTSNATNISTEKPTNLGHAQWGQPKIDSSFSRLFNQTGVSQRNASQSHTSPLQHLDALSDDRKSTRKSYSTSASVPSMGTSLQDMVSSTGTESLGTIEGRSRFLPSSIEGTAQSSDASKFFISRSNNLTGPTSIPSHMANSRKTLFDQTARYNEEYDTAGLVATPTDVTIPVTQPFSSLWVSARYPVETTAHVAMPTSATLTKLQSEETSGVSTQQQMEPLSLSWSSHGRISRRVEPRDVFPPSIAIARSHLDPENSTAIHPSEESVTASPPIHSLVTGVSSSAQQSTADSILQGSQQLEVSFMTPLTNSSPPGSSTLEAEFSLDVASNESYQMVPGPTDTIPTSVAKTLRHKVSLAFATATVGLLNPSLESQSSLLKENSESFPTTSSFGTSKEDEVSLTSHNMLNSSLVEVIKLEPKDITSSMVEGYVDPTTSVDVSFLNHQTSSPFSTLLSGNAETGLRVSFQTDLLETTANTTDYGKPLETQYYGRKRQTTANMKEIPTSNSPLTAMETDSVRKLTSVQPVDALSKRGSGATPLSPLSSTTPMSKMWQTSNESSESETITDSLVMKVFSLGTTENDSVPSPPYLDIGDVLQPIGATSTRLTYTDLPEGYTTSAPLESFGSPSVEQKLPSPSDSHPTVSLPGLIEFDRSLVTPSHHSSSSSITSIPFSRISIPESTLKTFINITEGHLVRKGLVMPRGTESFSATPLSVDSRNTVDGIALSLPTKVPRVGLSTSSVMVTMENALGHQVTGTSTANNIQTIDRTTLPIHSSRFTTSSNSDVLAYLSSVLQTKSNQATPIFSASTTLWTIQRTLPVESKTTCRNISCPASIFTPPQNISTQSMTSQPFLTRKFLSTILGTMEPKNNVTLADAKVSRTEEREMTTLPRTKIVTGVQHDHWTRSKFTTSLLNQSVKDNLTLGKFASTVPAVRILSLWFRLIKINYTNSLMNKSSERYKKLEKEIKLILKKMLSTYENFLRARVLRFLNGSVIVESQVVFQAMGLLPTPSDIIRTIVTEVERFSLKNLEPEKLAVFFSLLEMGFISTFDDKNFVQEHMESLKIKMKLLLETRYAVHLISLVDKRNTQGGVDINGNIFIKSDSHVDVHWILKALIGLSNVSVDLISLSINGSKLNLQVFPISFLITNRIFNEKVLDRSSVERQNIAKDLSDTLTRILGKYKNLLQVAIRKITGGSLVCYGDVIFQQPAPSNKAVLQTLAFSVDPKDYLDSSSFQVDRFSFTVAGAGLEPSLKKSGVPVYVTVLIPKALARRGKITINRESDAGVDIEAFELDNPGYQATVEEKS